MIDICYDRVTESELTYQRTIWISYATICKISNNLCQILNTEFVEFRSEQRQSVLTQHCNQRKVRYIYLCDLSFIIGNLVALYF